MYMIKVFLKLAAAVVWLIVAVVINLVVSALLGALGGWLIDKILGGVLVDFCISLGVAPLYMWQIGAIAGLVCGFFTNYIRVSFKKDKMRR